MLWILLVLFCVSLAIYFSMQKDKAILACPCLICAILPAVYTVMLLSEGIATYPQLVGQLHRVRALQQRVDDIRAAIYPEQPGKLVGGSLTNLQQSSKLSDYLSRLAEAEAEYSASLAKARSYKRSVAWVVLRHGLFISSKVFQLPDLDTVKKSNFDSSGG